MSEKVWVLGVAVVVRDDRDDAIFYRIGGNRKAGYTLYRCGARPPYLKTGMPREAVGLYPTLHCAIKRPDTQFTSDWRDLNPSVPSDYYGGTDGLYRLVCEAWGAAPTGRERPEPRRVLPPYLRCPMARADAVEVAARKRANKAAATEDATVLTAEKRAMEPGKK